MVRAGRVALERATSVLVDVNMFILELGTDIHTASEAANRHGRRLIVLADVGAPPAV